MITIIFFLVDFYFYKVKVFVILTCYGCVPTSKQCFGFKVEFNVIVCMSVHCTHYVSQQKKLNGNLRPQH